MFDTQMRKRHVIRADERNMTDDEKVVAKLIEPGYSRYQDAMRAPKDGSETKKTLIECAQIVESLARAHAESETSRERYATVFPGGAKHPDQLVKGREYTEPGVVFVGGERRGDDGYRMEITLKKGIPVDARDLYGHRGDNDKKLQWLTLPGAKFRFDGVSGSGAEKNRTYRFTQIDR